MVKKIDLIENDTCFKLIVPKEVERKIRILCREIHNIEWSGVLFYQVEGSFDNNDLVITCTDIYQMDIGNASYTEYTITPEVSSYMLDHDLLGHYIGHIHSHHNMSTFFSGTDNQELIDGGSSTNHFLSLIVNNKGDYTAAITRKIESERNIVEDFTYKSFNNVECKGQDVYADTYSYIEKFKLDIEVCKVEEVSDEVLDRIKELRDMKKSKTINTVNNSTYTPFSTDLCKSPYNPNLHYSSFKEPKVQEFPLDDIDSVNYNYSAPVDKDSIETVVKQLLTCSIIITDNSKVDIKKWAENLNKIYTNIFGSVPNFESFATNYVDFVLNNFVDEELDKLTNDPYEATSILAFKVKEYMEKLPKNVWINKYISILDDFII